MVAYFKRECYLFSILGAIGGLLVAAALYPGMISHQPGYMRMFYIALITIAGLVFGREYAIHWSGRHLARVDEVLYQSGKPQEFLDAFAPMVARIKPDTAEAMAGKIKMAFAREAQGDFRQALESLEDLDPEILKLHALPVAANLRNQQLRLALLLEDQELADTYLAQLQHLMETAQGRAPGIASQLQQCVYLAGCWMAVLNGVETDENYLAEEIRLSNNPIHKSEMQLLLARAQENRGDECFRETLLEARATGQGLWTGEKAQALIQQQF